MWVLLEENVVGARIRVTAGLRLHGDLRVRQRTVRIPNWNVGVRRGCTGDFAGIPSM
jgi:hypothetical protein